MGAENRRLTSWKDISGYVGRDIRTVARWERERGLPVHRVPGGRKSTVFAWTHEIDAWLASEPPPDAPSPPKRVFRDVVRIAAPVVLLAVAFIALIRTNWLHGAEPIEGVRVEGASLVATTVEGRTAWTHQFDAPMSGDYTGVADIDGDGHPEALAVLSKLHDPEGRQVFYCFANDGELRWRLEPRDTLEFGSESFGAPWNNGGVIAYTAGTSHRILWVTHHHTWWPGIVRMLNPDGYEVARFVNPGWITSAAVTASGTALLVGTNNAEDADVFAVLDDRSWPGSAPEPGAPRYRCRNCPAGKPAFYFLLPRSDLNRAIDAPRDVSSVSPFPDSIQAQTIQVQGDGQLPSAAVVFEFARDFTPMHARANDAYWAWHDRLFREGKIDHPASRCPERRGYTIREWRRDHGWSTVFVPAADD